MTHHEQAATSGGKRILGFPLEGFGCLTSLLLTLASAFFTFFAVTTLAIFALLGWNQLGGHAVNYAYSYLYAGLPAGLLVLALAAPLFGVLWIRSHKRNESRSSCD